MKSLQVGPSDIKDEEDKFFGKNIKGNPTLTPEQEELSDSKMRNPKGNSEEVSVIENLPIALRKGKRLC